ncbi:MAG: hypothetical protein ACFFB7_08085, partial [Candidatus Sifarchaeia archaeon]
FVLRDTCSVAYFIVVERHAPRTTLIPPSKIALRTAVPYDDFNISSSVSATLSANSGSLML